MAVSRPTTPSDADDDAAARAWYEELPRWRDELDEFLRTVLPLPEGPRLPVVLWSRLSFDLESYLTERRAEGADLLAFSHRELDDVAKATYASEEAGRALHERLADYFHAKADPHDDQSWTTDGEHVDLRGLSELPFHLTHAERWDEVYDTLTDFRFLEQKAAKVGVTTHGEGDEKTTVYTGVFALQDDFDTALRAMPGGEGAGAGSRRLIVTAVDFGEGLVVRCPHCNTVHEYREDWKKDPDIDCPNPDCNGPLKINPFVVERSAM